MTTKKAKVNTSKPTLIKVGDHYVSTDNVAGFKQAKKGLYILQLKSSPEAEYPLWVSEKELEAALPYFTVIG
jgi:hypothetical protein